MQPVRFPKIPLYEGWLAPMRAECDVVSMEVVQGAVPPDLNGTWFRSGSDRQYPPLDGTDIFIDGEGVMHRLHIENGYVDYKSRWVRTERFLAQEQAKRALFGRYRNRYTSDPSVRDLSMSTANTTALWHGGKLLALKEDGLPHELDPVTLSTKGTFDYDGQVTSLTMSAHPKLDMRTNELVTFGYQAKGDATDDIVLYVIGSDRNIIKETWFKMPYACMVHDFGITDTHAIFVFVPMITSLETLKAGGPFYEWHPHEDLRVAIVPRDGAGDIQWFRGPNASFGHTMNAFRDGNTFHMDVTYYDGNVFPFFPNVKTATDSLLVSAPDVPVPPAKDGVLPPPIITRLTMQSGSSGIVRTVLCKMPGEMPKTDERYQGYAYRHGYMIVRPRVDANRSANLESAVGHIDHKTGALKVWAPGPLRSVNEPQFVPRNSTAAEGEGWLLVLVNRLDENCTDLAILDAQDIEAGPVATVRIPLRVRYSIHGCWAPLQ